LLRLATALLGVIVATSIPVQVATVLVVIVILFGDLSVKLDVPLVALQVLFSGIVTALVVTVLNVLALSGDNFVTYHALKVAKLVLLSGIVTAKMGSVLSAKVDIVDLIVPAHLVTIVCQEEIASRVLVVNLGFMENSVKIHVPIAPNVIGRMGPVL